jgi:hypothetical protein
MGKDVEGNGLEEFLPGETKEHKENLSQNGQCVG